jgi:hypothetical protein
MQEKNEKDCRFKPEVLHIILCGFFDLVVWGITLKFAVKPATFFLFNISKNSLTQVRHFFTQRG